MNDLNTQALAIVGGTIIDGTGGKPIDKGVILIEGKRITAVGAASTEVPLHAKKISATGKYVIPGLMDANVHLYFQHNAAELIQTDERYEHLIAEAAQISLRNGLTTVFDTWGPRSALTRVRDRINGSEIPGSRFFFAGNIIGLGGPTSADFFPAARDGISKAEADSIDIRWEQGVGPELLWMTSSEVRSRIREYIQSGEQDFLKYAASGHGQFQFICFSERVQRMIVEEGRRAGLTVQTHTTSPESLRMAIEAGADLLQHPDLTGMTPMPEETLSVITERRIPCAALFFTRKFLNWSNSRIPEPYRTFNQNKHRNHERLVAAAAQILLTTDSAAFSADVSEDPALDSFVAADDSPLMLGKSHFLWLEAAAELGMKPMDALMAATKNIAEAYRVDENLGTLVKGKIADLLILDKNPLEAASNYRSISLVMKDGRIIDTDTLPSRKPSADLAPRAVGL